VSELIINKAILTHSITSGPCRKSNALQTTGTFSRAAPRGHIWIPTTALTANGNCSPSQRVQYHTVRSSPTWRRLEA
jgi:hypothetical protein